MASVRAASRGITVYSLAAFLCLLLLLTWTLIWSSATLKVDRLIHDRWVSLSLREPPSDIVVAGIDPESLSALGRWPWPRNIQALLFERLADMQVKAVVVDLIYTERSDSQANDQKLVDAIERLPMVFLPVLTEGTQGNSFTEKLPLPQLSRAATDLGHINLPIDSDGIVRRFHLKAGSPSPHWSAMALAALEHIEPNADDILRSLPGRRSPSATAQMVWQGDYEVHIPFYGPRESFRTLSVLNIINGRVDPEALKDKIVFVGMLSTGLNDIVPSPVSARNQSIPGVEVHANVYAALRDKSLITAIDLRWNLLWGAVLLPLMMLLYSRARMQWLLLLAVGGALLPIFVSFLLYRFSQLWFAPLSVSVPVLVSYLLWSWNRLDFINRFIERETLDMSAQVQRTDYTHNTLLAEFFETASKHLPIKGWRFSAKGEEFSGGEAIAERDEIDIHEQWLHANGVYRKRYPTPGRLSISLIVDSPYVAGEITDYVDSLARVQERIEPSRLSGSIERLQSNAVKLSDQMEWLRSVQKFSETIMAGSSAGFMVWNSAGELINSNIKIYSWFPDLPSEALLCDFLEVVGKGAVDTVDEERLARLVLHGESSRVTFTQDEQEYVISFDTVGEHLKDRLICASVIDVTDIRSVERARSEMVEYLSHDLRSPLISSMYLLEDLETSLSNDGVEATEKVQLNIKRSLTMMDDLLQVAKADTLSAENFDELLLNDVLDNAMDQLAPQAQSRSIALEQPDSQCEVWLDGDPGLLERAVVNVIGNAIKYSEDGKRVVVAMELSDNEQMVTVSVQDEGVGIDSAIIGDIFKRFKRDARVAKQFKGIGLGLALVAKVVSQHGGSVEAESEGQGTCIKMRLPIKFVEYSLDEQAASVGRSIQ
ncbi:MAG: CHASE2 domain-containing protein [Gammaproteobacteria bacterium]|nr:CHASE2 domain-containing protein [Gammaproteobacteria bacterium]